jgi:L-ascorbate metabolism protein UlaG (beta-lactamase superfamily)
MKLTKLGHSCVLVETPDRVGLFDPGSWSDRALIDDVKHVDRIIYTHEHADHFDLEILKSLLVKFPEAHVISNLEVQKLINDAGIKVILRDESACTVKFNSPHEAPPWPNTQAPAENGYHFKGVFTHPGDSYSFNETKQVLAMPFVGPWADTGSAIKKVLELRPKYVLSIHDWLLTDEAKAYYQSQLQISLSDAGITLLPNENGRVIEL